MDYVKYFQLFDVIFTKYQIADRFKKVFEKAVEQYTKNYNGHGRRKLPFQEQSRVLPNMKYIKHLDNKYNCREERKPLDFNDFVHDWFSERVVKKWKDTFEEFDKDKSGDLDAEEVECYLSFLGQIGEQGEKVRATLMESDTDGNRKISRDEFEEFVKAELREKLEAILEEFIVKIDQDWLNGGMYTL
ncbi:uncharacterized protein LOC141912227 [Tubulanus polymorphus]|uniref:uncharacterized protein LOC141912227 n=1 Tax=Tubulanus polymorphus TaxID=672921 RepID=UPI003DA1E1A1